MTDETKPQTVLVTRFCRADMTAYNNFKWPTSGPVSCNDWDPLPRCGGGLHGWLWGKGDPAVWDVELDDKMLVVEVQESDIVTLGEGEKVKFPKGNVVHCGTRESATTYMKERGHGGILFGCARGSGRSRFTHKVGTVEAGDYGEALAGEYGSAVVGKWGVARAGDYGNATGGLGSTATAGYQGKATAGFRGFVTVGTWGKAEVGDEGHALAGPSGTAKAGDYGIAEAEINGYAMAGQEGEIRIRWFDRASSNGRYRTAVGYVGEDGIEPNVLYHVVAGKFVKVGNKRA